MRRFKALAPIRLNFGRVMLPDSTASRYGGKLKKVGDGVYAILREIELKAGTTFSADHISKGMESFVLKVEDVAQKRDQPKAAKAVD